MSFFFHEVKCFPITNLQGYRMHDRGEHPELIVHGYNKNKLLKDSNLGAFRCLYAPQRSVLLSDCQLVSYGRFRCATRLNVR